MRSEPWIGLVGLMPRFRRALARTSTDLPLKARSAHVANAVFGDLMKSSGLIGYTIGTSTLAIVANGSPEIWMVRPSASAVIRDTDLRSIPRQAPRPLRAPGIIETKHPETGERLFGDCAALAWYIVDGVVCLLGMMYPGGYFTARWVPQWTGEDLEEQLPGLEVKSPLITDPDLHKQVASDAAQYLVVLSLLEDIAKRDQGPLRFELDLKSPAKKHDVYIRDRRTPPKSSKASSPEVGPVAPVMPGSSSPIPELRPVAGHIRLQHYGPGNSKSKHIYVPPGEGIRYLRPRWVVTAPTLDQG